MRGDRSKNVFHICPVQILFFGEVVFWVRVVWESTHDGKIGKLVAIVGRYLSKCPMQRVAYKHVEGRLEA